MESKQITQESLLFTITQASQQRNKCNINNAIRRRQSATFFLTALLAAVATTNCLPSLLVSQPVEGGGGGSSSGNSDEKYNCPLGWTRYGAKKCLRYVNEVQDFDKAQQICRSGKNQGNLVTIHSTHEQNFVFSYIHSIAASSTPIWLGAKQMDFESILWLDKAENSYTNWAPSQPSHPDEICIAVNPRTGLWHDVMCSEFNLPACERSPTTQWPFFVAFCPEGWFQLNDEKCIRIISSQALNFYESQELCRSKYNSKLLSIKTDAENEFVHNLVKFRDINMPVWLGAIQNDFSAFSWLDKSDVKFTNWAEGEPNDPDHACMSMSTAGSGKWADNDCKEQKLILCQKSVNVDEGACETGWLQFRQTKCYRFVHVRLSYDDAESLCSNLYGAHLPSIHSQEEQFMITQFLASVSVKNNSEIWLGGKQMDLQNFNWVDQSAFNFSHWEPGEPGFPSDKCIEMSWRSGRWTDINCRLKRAVLCERPIVPPQLQPTSQQQQQSTLQLTFLSSSFSKPNLYSPTEGAASSSSSSPSSSSVSDTSVASNLCSSGGYLSDTAAFNNGTGRLAVNCSAVQRQSPHQLSPAIQQDSGLHQLLQATANNSEQQQQQKATLNNNSAAGAEGGAVFQSQSLAAAQSNATLSYPATIQVVSSIIKPPPPKQDLLAQPQSSDSASVLGLESMSSGETVVSARSELTPPALQVASKTQPQQQQPPQSVAAAATVAPATAAAAAATTTQATNAAAAAASNSNSSSSASVVSLAVVEHVNQNSVPVMQSFVNVTTLPN